MEKVDYMDVAPEAMKQISGDGAFLTVKLGDSLNTMTIGWATIGFVWKKPIFTAAVRLSRYTFGMLEKAENFTVSVPFQGEMSEELAACGSSSGKSVDKFADNGLVADPAQAVSSPIIRMAGIHYECSLYGKTPMDPALFNDASAELYPAKDYHTLYYGEIVDCYRT